MLEQKMQFNTDLNRYNPETKKFMDATIKRPGKQDYGFGAFYRVHKNIKLGAMYQLERGSVHDDDWIRDDDNPHSWRWKDTRDRNEHIAIFDFTPKVQLNFMPGKSWVFEIKSRYSYN